MANSPLMTILIECENNLGWVPDKTRAQQTYKARATMHKIMTTVMSRQNISEEDLRLALNYCKHRRLPIDSPLQLLPLVAKAKEHMAVPDATGAGQVQQKVAIAWEVEHGDEESQYWIGLLVRSRGSGLSDTLTQWRDAGRGR